MTEINKYLLLFLIFVFGFTLNENKYENIVINWQTSTDSLNIAGYIFVDAANEWKETHFIPVFVKEYILNSPDENYIFTLHNPVFEEIEIHHNLIDKLPLTANLQQTRVVSGNVHKIVVKVSSVIQKEDKIYLLKKFQLRQVSQPLKIAHLKMSNWQENSVLSTGKWMKISTTDKGIYKIPYSRLSSWGFSDPSRVNIFGTGGKILSEIPGSHEFDDLPQVSVWHGKNNGTDCIFFYVPGTVEWDLNSSNEHFEQKRHLYSNNGFFFLTESVGSNKTVELLEVPGASPTHSITSFDDFILHETDQVNLLQSGRQWYGEKFTNATTRNFSFQLPNLEPNSTSSIRVKAIGRSSLSSELTITAGSTNIGKLTFNRVNLSDGEGLHASEATSRFFLQTQTDNLPLELKYSGNGVNPEAWLDFIEINFKRQLWVQNEALFFRDKESVGINNILEFKITGNSSDLKVWDVTNAPEVKEVPLTRSGEHTTGKQASDILREYAAFSPNGNFPEPEMVGEVENQNLHGLGTPEYIIITHPAFQNAANNLAQIHRNHDGMGVEVVSVDKIYNEFSSGKRDATGIRNFIKMLYDRREGLKYVLLFGDGSYDNKGINSGSLNLIPTYQSENSLNHVLSYVTDDYFVILDDGENLSTGAIDLGIGRIPASTPFEAELAVQKIDNYQSKEALGNWRNILCFIGDDEDGNLHMSDSEKLANQVNASNGEFITDKIYFDAYRQITGPGGESYPEVTEAINDRVKEGVLILNYVGHANDRFLAKEKVLDISHINSWSNSNKLPIFVTATCEFSRFDADHKSAGEYVFFNPNGGAIGLFSTTRLVYANSNYALSTNFYKFVFGKDQNGKPYRMGDIMRLAKFNTKIANNINKRNFSLLADPALKLSYPENKVVTTTINSHSSLTAPDTIGALQKVSVSGYITNRMDHKLDNFTGKISITVYDKATTSRTRGNAGQQPMNFKVQENILFKGQTEVVNGEFTFEFVVPRDISYNPGNGKIVYYAYNDETDAHGVFENFVISGSASEITDIQGPEIELYLDNHDFQSGDNVSRNPVLLAKISDDNGINMVGSGIGHDITAVLNDDYSKVFVLNNFYEANLNDSKSGTVRFPLRNLPLGKNTLKLKAWDVANNSSEATIEFEVTSDFYIQNAQNYPNPMNNHTYFTFEHNQPDGIFEAIFEIFNMNGSRITQFKRSVSSNGNVSNPVRWDLNEAGIRAGSGSYLFRITVQNSDGTITTGTGKFIISN